MTEKTATTPQLERAAHLADLYVEVEAMGLLHGWEAYIKAEAQAIGMPWKRMEQAIARRKSSSAPQAHGE